MGVLKEHIKYRYIGHKRDKLKTMNFQACDKENERNMDIKRHALVLRQLCCCHLSVLSTHGNTL